MDRTAAEWLTSPEVTAQVAALRKDRDERIEKLTAALEACYLTLPTNCDKADPGWNVVYYADDDWRAVAKAAAMAREVLFGVKQ